MQVIIEPKCRFNTRRLPPVPDWIPQERRAFWRAAWRDLYQYWRWQVSEDGRFWLTCAETVGRKLTLEQLGPRGSFVLIIT